MDWQSITVVICAAYFLGACPIDRAIASVLRAYCCVCGKRSDAFTRSVANILKGCAVVSISRLAGPEAPQIAVLFVFLGHIVPIHRGFKGGNGMAILLGAMIALHPLLGLVALFSWLLTYYVYPYAALAAIISASVTPFFCVYIGLNVSLNLLLLLTSIVLWRQRHSLVRLTEGTEEKVAWD